MATTKQLICGFCGREFIHKKKYESHLLICDQIEKSKYKLKHKKYRKIKIANKNIRKEDNKKIENSTTQNKITHIEQENNTNNEIIPSQAVMFQMIQTLVEKCNKLENEVETCKKYINQTKKKISILEWLNSHYSLETNYSEWKQKIKINGDNMKYIFTYGYIDGVLMILQNMLPLDKVDEHVIKCFDQKQGIFFYYNQGTWNVMDNKIFQTLLVYINIELTREFDEGWVEPNKEKILTEKIYNDMYYKYEKRIQGDNKTNEQLIRGIKSKLYQYLKCNLKNIIEYEFTF